MVWATGAVGDRPVRLRNGYGPRFGSITGDLGPERIRLTFSGSSEHGTLSGSIAGEHVEVVVHAGQVIGRVSTDVVQHILNPSIGLPKRVTMPTGTPLVDLVVDHQRLGRDVSGRCDRPSDAVVALAILMQTPSPSVFSRLALALALRPRRSVVDPAPG